MFEEDYRGSVDLYAQRLNSNGVRQWGSGSGVAICTAGSEPALPAIAGRRGRCDHHLAGTARGQQ